VTLSNKDVLRVLQSSFVCGYRNITDQEYAGASGDHAPDGAAVTTTNGAGGHNVQIFLLTPDGTVLTCLPGFWAPEDLLCELKFAVKLYNEVWMRGDVTPEQKEKAFSKAHLAHRGTHSRSMMERSQLQGFDAWHESGRMGSDFVFKRGDWRPSFTLRNPMGSGGPRLKTVDQVMHERIAEQPFCAYEEFDVAAFSDYGQLRYDKEEDERASRELASKSKPGLVDTTRMARPGAAKSR